MMYSSLVNFVPIEDTHMAIYVSGFGVENNTTMIMLLFWEEAHINIEHLFQLLPIEGVLTNMSYWCVLRILNPVLLF